ncbi:MAG: D-galactonate dehydratase, partial [Rubellimicrobium sp.]|nr:D-galactonate dehydratase [Rubellimicrobium sp.]
MRITAITSVVCNAKMRNWVFVRVETDVPGLIGWGEATLEWKTRAVVGAIDDLAPLIVGRDPRDIEQAVQVLTRHGFFRMGVIGMSAISGIEIALWDIFGKHLGQPVWRLLGGACRNHLRTYTHLGMGEMGAVYESTGAALAERGRAVVEAGYDAVKVVSIPYSHYLSSNRDIDAVESAMMALRDAVGPDVDIMVDAHGRPASVPLAKAYLRALEPCRPFFVEEPLPPEDMAGLAEITRDARLPIA